MVNMVMLWEKFLPIFKFQGVEYSKIFILETSTKFLHLKICGPFSQFVISKISKIEQFKP